MWARGPARVRDGFVELEAASVYTPADEGVDDLPFALAGIRSANEAVAFARRFSLLRTPPSAAVHRERLADWKILAAARRDATRRDALGLYSSARAARDGDEDAVERARRIMVEREWATSPEFRAQLDELPGTLAKADASVGAILTFGIAEVRMRVQPAALVTYPSPQGRRNGEAGHFFFVFSSPSP